MTPEREETAAFLNAEFRHLKDAGIQVFLFVPPTPEPTFSEADLRRLFSASGAVTLRLPEKRYSCFDGSHLDGHGAKQFSRDLGTALADQWSGEKSQHAL